MTGASNSYETALFKAGNATGVRLPKALLETFDLKTGDPVKIESSNGSIILTPTTYPKPDTVLVNGVLEVLEDFYRGKLGRYTKESDAVLHLETIDHLGIKAYRTSLFSKKGQRMHQDILIPIDYLNDFKQLLSFLYDYFLISNKNNGFDYIVKSKRETLFNKWFHESHDEFYDKWNVDKSVYYDWMKGCVLNGSK